MITANWVGSSKAILRDGYCKWVCDQLWPGQDRTIEGPCLVILDKNNLLCTLVYHNYEPDAGVIEITGASVSPRWLTRSVLHRMFAYPFEELGCQLVVMRVSEHNTRLKRILLTYGFKPHTIDRLRGRNEAEVIYTLTDDAWKANKFEVTNGQAQSS